MSKKKQKDILHYASSGVKIKAFLTDSFMILLPILYVVFYFIMDGRDDFASHKIEGWLYILGTLIVVQTIFLKKTGQTPGYRAYDLRLIDEKTKKTPSIGAIIFRNTSIILSILTFIGWIIMFFRKDSKTLHDFLSATAIVYKPHENQ